MNNSKIKNGTKKRLQFIIDNKKYIIEEQFVRL